MARTVVIRWLVMVSVMTLSRRVTCLPAVSLDMGAPFDPTYAILLQPEIETHGYYGGDETLDREERAVSSGQGEVPPGLSDDEDMMETNKPEVLKMTVLSRVTSRFASTEVRSKIKNVGKTLTEATFTILLPEEAFISAFSMTIEGVVYHSEVLPKEKAQKAYNEAKAKGQTAGQVKQSSPKETKFTVSVAVSARTSVIFNVTYQQLLKRARGRFENHIRIQPDQVLIPDVRIEVHVNEPQGLAWLNSTWLLGDQLKEQALDNLTSVDVQRRSAKVLFDTRGDGGILAGSYGVMADFVVQYDVVRDTKAGHLEIVDGYFIHYFSPDGLPTTRKNVVFVVDTSGSMNGRKIEQTKEALLTILDDVREIDRFNIIFFESNLHVWRDNEMVDATRDNINEAKLFVDRIRAAGGTNIYDALMKAINLLTTDGVSEAFPLIIMLTDGQPTSGEVTNTADITSRVTAAIEGRVSLFSLGFGNGVDFNFLEKLSLSNGALARKIYEDSNADLQVKGFYDEVANPLLFDVNIEYDHRFVDRDSLTKSAYKAFFDGTEITVAGKLKDEVIYGVWTQEDAIEPEPMPSTESLGGSEPELCVVISAKSLDVDIEFNTSTTIEDGRSLRPHDVEGFTRRLWAYLTIKDLLNQRKIATNSRAKEDLTQKALNLSLDYHFVTPLTSLLVVRPDDAGGNATFMEELEKETPLNDGLAPNFPPQRRLIPIRPHPGFQPTGQADSDPHFMVEIPNTEVNVCFDINGDPGDVFVLLIDPIIGFSVSGEVIPAANSQQTGEAPTPQGMLNGTDKISTYFGKIAIHLGPAHILAVTTEGVELISDERPLHRLEWREAEGLAMRTAGFVFGFVGKRQLIISRGDDIVVAVMLHRVGERRAAMKDNHRVDHLGFYIEKAGGLSDHVHGLLGQFQRQQDVLISVHSDITADSIDQKSATTATLNLEGRKVSVTRKTRRVPMTHGYHECWHAPNNGEGLIEGVYTDYTLQSLYDRPTKWN